jgi:hypothetical protein
MQVAACPLLRVMVVLHYANLYAPMLRRIGNVRRGLSPCGRFVVFVWFDRHSYALFGQS